MTRTTVQVHVGETMEEVGARAVGAWHRMARGEQVDEKHVSFATWETLRHVHQNPAPNIRALAQSLHRDDRRVHDEVEARAAAGLLDRDADGVRADYDAFDVRMTVAL